MESCAKGAAEKVCVAVENLAVPEVLFPKGGKASTVGDEAASEENINYRCAVPEVRVAREAQNPSH